jgi:hypothetical protein
MAISYLGKATQDVFTVGANQQAIVDGRDGIDTIYITENQTVHSVNATQDTTQGIVFDAGVTLQSVTVETIPGTEIVTSRYVTINDGVNVEVSADTTFQIGGTSYADINELKAFVDANPDYVVTGNEDATPAPEFTVTSDVAAVDEGSAVAFSISNAEADKDYAYKITGVDAADIDQPLMGTVTTDTNGDATLSVGALADEATEGLESMNFSVVGESANVAVDINDTSLTPTPAPAATLSAASESINEGEAASFTLSAEANTTYDYAFSGIQSADVTEALTGSVTTDASGNATIPLTTVADQTTEGTETITVNVTGNGENLTATTEVNDTSTLADTAQSYTIDGANDPGKTMASLDDMGSVIEVENFVQGTSKIDVKDVFTSLTNGFVGSEDADTVMSNSVEFQPYGNDILVFMELASIGDITNAGNITLRLVSPLDANGDALTSLSSSDFIGIPTTVDAVFTAELDYATQLDATDNIVQENTGSDINGLDLVDFGDGDDTLWLNNVGNLTNLQSGNISNLENIYVTNGSGDVEIHDAFLNANGNNINVDSSGVGSSNTLTLNTEDVSGANSVTLTGTATATLADGGPNSLTIGDDDGTNSTSTVVGGDDVDTITGGDRADTIDGKAGDDVISAGAGKDQITGGVGADTLTGGEGQDAFIYDAESESDGTLVTDTIKDFTWSVDKIDLSNAAISGQIGNGFKTEGTINSVWTKDDGNDILVYVETDSSWAAEGDEEMIIRLENPTKADGTAITASDINFLDFVGVSAFTPSQDIVVGRATDDTFTVSTAADLDLDGTNDDDDTIDGGDGYDKLSFNADQSNGTRIFDGATVVNVEEIEIQNANAATNLTIKDNFVTTSQGADGADAGSDDDIVKISAADASANTDITIDTSDLTTGTVALESGAANAVFNLADTTDGNKNITVATGAVAAVALTDTDAAGIDEFTGGTGDDTVIVADNTLHADVLSGGASDADDVNGDTILIDAKTTAVTADDIANVTNFENVVVTDANNTGITFNDANIAAGETMNVSIDGGTNAGTTGVLTLDGTAESDGAYAVDLANATQNTTVDVNVENFTGAFSGTAFSGDDATTTTVELDLHTAANATVTAADLANVTDLDTLKVTGDYNWDITLSGSEVDGNGADKLLTVDTTDVGTGDVSVDATNEKSQDIITVAGTPAQNDTITVTINGTALSAYTLTAADVAGDDATADAELTAASLAAHINSNTSAVTASADGAVVRVTSATGSSLAVTTSVTGAVTATAADHATDLELDSTGSTGAVSYDVNQHNIETDLTATGGNGTDDTLTVHGAGDLSLGTGITAIENLVVNNTNAAGLTITVADENAAAGETLAINATAVTGAVTFDAQADTDGILQIETGNGDNIFKLDAANFDHEAQTITAGTGDDTLQLMDTMTIDAADLANVTGVETFATQANAAYDITLNDANAEGTVLTVDTATVTTADVNVNASAEDDTGVTVKVANGQFNATTDIFTGGSTTDDKLVFTGGDVSVTSTNAAGITAVETIEFDGNNAVSFVTNDANVAAGKSITLDATDVLTAEKTLTLNAGAETNGKVTAQIDGSVEQFKIINVKAGDASSPSDTFTAEINGDSYGVNFKTDVATTAGNLVAGINAATGVDYSAVDLGAGLIAIEGGNSDNIAITLSTEDVDSSTGTPPVMELYDASKVSLDGGAATDTFQVKVGGTAAAAAPTAFATDLATTADSLVGNINSGSVAKAANSTTVATDVYVYNDTDGGTIDQVTTAIGSSASMISYDVALSGGAADSTSAGAAITGGSGTTDVLEVTSDGAAINIAEAQAASITQFENVKFTSDVDVNFTHANVSLGAASKMTYDATALSTDSSLTFDGSNEADADGVLNIFGGSGADVLTGGAAADVLRGAMGADTLTGNGGADRFVFNTEDFDSSADVITDFGTTDEIYLQISGAVDFNSDVMNWNSTGAFNTGTQWEDVTQVRKAGLDNGDTMIQFDINGDGQTDQDITLTGVDATTVTTDSFVFG